MEPRILAFAGSLRRESFNKKLLNIAAEGARKSGAKVTVVDLRDFPLPLYDGDLEQTSGLPENAKKLKQLMKEHHGFLIASPEYNSSYSGVLKNVIDWTSRPEPGEPSLVCYKEKVAAIMSASPGNLGGLRGLWQLRTLLSNISVLVLPDQRAISSADKAFNEAGDLKDATQKTQIEALAGLLTNTLAKLITN